MKAKFIMIASSKGGVGKSTAALGISRALCNGGKKVLLCDLDFGNACLDMLLGVQDSVIYTLQDAAGGTATAKDTLIKIEADGKGKKKKRKKASNEETAGELWLLPSAAGGMGCTPEYSGEGGIDDEAVRKAVRDGADAVDADIVIIDTGAGVNRAVYAAADLADSALVVTGQMPVALRSAESTVERLSALGVEDIRLIINSFDAKGVLGEQRRGIITVIDSSRASLAGVVPYDYCLSLAHEGLESRKSGKERMGDSAIAFDNIAKRLCGETVPIFLGMKKLRKIKKKICL